MSRDVREGSVRESAGEIIEDCCLANLVVAREEGKVPVRTVSIVGTLITIAGLTGEPPRFLVGMLRVFVVMSKPPWCVIVVPRSWF